MSASRSGKDSGRKKRKKMKYEARLEAARRNEAMQNLKDAERVKLLEQQLAYVQWKKRKNNAKMKEAIEKGRHMLEYDAITEVATDEMDEKRRWMQHIIADEMRRPLRVFAYEKNPGSYDVETKKRREITRLENHHTAIKALEKTLRDKEGRRHIHEKHLFLRSQTPPAPLWKTRHSMSSHGSRNPSPSSPMNQTISGGPLSTRGAQIQRLKELRRTVYQKFKTETKAVQNLVRHQKDQPLNSPLDHSVDRLRRP